MPSDGSPTSARFVRAFSGLSMLVFLSGAVLLVHTLPLGLVDTPEHGFGVVGLLGMGLLYVVLALLQRRPQSLESWRRWSYAGFYVDEVYTRLALKLWPTKWIPDPSGSFGNRPSVLMLSDEHH